MKKKIFLTSLLLAAGAIVLASCGSKKVDDSNINESTNATNTDNDQDNNQGDNVQTDGNESNNGGDNVQTGGNQVESQTTNNLVFFDENSFELPEDFNYKSLEKINLSLKQEILYENSKYNNFNAYEAKTSRTQTTSYYNVPYTLKAEQYVRSELYSNDVVNIVENQRFDDDGAPIYNSSSPFRSLPIEILPIDSTPVISIPAIDVTPVSYLGFAPFDYNRSFLGIAKNNYTFYSTTYHSPQDNSEENYFDDGKQSSKLIDKFYESLPNLTDFQSYLLYEENETPVEFYKYDDNHIVVVNRTTFSDSFEEVVGYDYKYDEYIYDMIINIQKIEELLVYEITDDGFELVFGSQGYTILSNYVYDEETLYYTALDGIKPVETFKTSIKFSSKVIEYNDDIKDKFKHELVNIDADEVYNEGTFDKNGNLIGITYNGDDSGKYIINGFEDGKFNLDVAFEVYADDVATLELFVIINELNDKVLNDELLTADDVSYIQHQATLSLTGFELPEGLEYKTYEGVKYIYGTPNIDSIYVILNVDVFINESGNIDYTINKTDFIKKEKMSIPYKIMD